MDHESTAIRNTQTLIPSRYLLVVLTFLLSLLLYIDRACISAATDSIRPALGFSEKQMGWVMSAFALGYAVFLDQLQGILPGADEHIPEIPDRSVFLVLGRL
jgi:MFS family permease